jgi:hypothetical protein
MRLLSQASANTKLRKSESSKYRVAGLALSPARAAGEDLPTNCPHASPSCIKACVGGEGVGMAAVFPAIMQARIAKTRRLRENRSEFLEDLRSELRAEERQADAEGRKLAVRLNTFTDIPYEVDAYGRIPWQFENIQFYDYTKNPNRFDRLPPNYALCLSWSEEEKQQESCWRALDNGYNVSIVFHEVGDFAGNGALRQRLPKKFNGFKVIDGDTTDLRFLDPSPVIVGLRLKAGSTEQRNQVIASGFSVEVL